MGLFVQNKYLHWKDNTNQISESAEIGDEVGITVHSLDGDPLDNINYSLINNTNEIFSIHSETGIVYISDNTFLVYEQE